MIQRIAIVFVITFLVSTTVSVADSGLITKPSAHSAKETLDRLKQAVTKRGFMVFTTLDHAAAAKSKGLEMPFSSVTISEPGTIKQTGEFNRFIFAERDSRPSARIDTLRNAINEAGSSAPPTDDVGLDLWNKFVLFSAVSGVTTAARCTISDILENDLLTELFRNIVSETAALGRACGVALSDTVEADIWSFAKNLPPTMRASTAIDLENGRPLEVEWITGAVCRLSQEAGIEAPVNQTIYAILSPYRYGPN